MWCDWATMPEEQMHFFLLLSFFMFHSRIKHGPGLFVFGFDHMSKCAFHCAQCLCTYISSHSALITFRHTQTEAPANEHKNMLLLSFSPSLTHRNSHEVQFRTLMPWQVVTLFIIKAYIGAHKTECVVNSMQFFQLVVSFLVFAFVNAGRGLLQPLLFVCIAFAVAIATLFSITWVPMLNLELKHFTRLFWNSFDTVPC